MIVGVPREVHPRESRVALLPEHAARLAHAGADMVVESGIGRSLGIPDEAYGKAGARVLVDRK
ncbi:MAG: NAD(P)(+) transhydrogenase (Re/Si-specific) subunit alpha, partial [Syntrophobacteraceae bacterium]